MNVCRVVDPTISAREYFPFREAHLILDTQRLIDLDGVQFRPFEVGAVQTYEWFSQNAGFGVPLSPAEQCMLVSA